MAVYLGVDTKRVVDGAGAQVQRLFAVYSLSKILNIKYFHNHITNLDYNIGDGIKNNSEMKFFLKKINNSLDFFEPRSVNIDITKKIEFRSLRFLLRIGLLHRFCYWAYFGLFRIMSFLSKKNYLFLTTNPYPLIERIPDSYLEIQKLLPDREFSKIISVQLHLNKARKKFLSRLTNDDWYLSTLNTVVSNLESENLEYEILIHTDVSIDNRWTLPEDFSRETLKYWQESGMEIINGEVSIAGIEELSNFKNLKNTKIITGIDAVDAWKIMAQADYLLLSKSSFSFTGALFNTHGKIFYPVFWHKGPKVWDRIPE
jgi:hypothetical protein